MDGHGPLMTNSHGEFRVRAMAKSRHDSSVDSPFAKVVLPGDSWGGGPGGGLLWYLLSLRP